MNRKCGYYDTKREAQCENTAEVARPTFANTPMEWVCGLHYFVAERMR